MPRGVAAGELVGAGGEQEVAGDGADLGAVGVALVVHGERLVARLRVNAEADMGNGIGVAVISGGEIAAHQLGVGAVALDARDVVGIAA